MADIFFSYANPDRERIVPLVRLLGKEGWSLWWDSRIPAGKLFDQVIEQEINKAKCVVVAWTKDSVKSRWVLAEASEGAQRNILIPILLDPVKVPLEFRRIQAARLVGWQGDPRDEGFLELLSALSAILRTSANVAHPASKDAGERMGTGKAGGLTVADHTGSEPRGMADPASPVPEAHPGSGEQASAPALRASRLPATRARLVKFAGRRTNAPLVIVLVLLVVILYLGFGYDSRRREIEPARRGMILDRTGDPSRALALNQRNAAGELKRVYPYDTTFSQLLGTERGEPGLDRTIFNGPSTDVRLTLDGELQEEAAAQLRGRNGAVVILNPQTGDVLALYSNPTYSIDETEDDDKWARLEANKRDEPLVNRALGNYYVPGELFNTVVMFAAFNNGLQNDKFNCSGGGFYAEPGAKPIWDPDGPGEVHGNLGLDTAYEVSCKQYFAQLAIKLGPKRLSQAASRLGITSYPELAQATRSPREPHIWNTSRDAAACALAPRQSTFVLSPQMSPYDLGLIGFGQGYVGRMTPFHMALLAATIGNLEGKLMKPKIEYDQPPEVWAQATTPERAAEMRRIMGLVTAGSSGTATSVFKDVHAQGILTGGKAGAAEKQVLLYNRETGKVQTETFVEHDLHGNPVREYTVPKLDPEFRIDSWFLCIAPLDRPRLAIAVIIEGGGFGTETAAPVAAALVLKAKELKLL